MILGIAIIVAFTAITLMLCISLVYNSDIGEEDKKNEVDDLIGDDGEAINVLDKKENK